MGALEQVTQLRQQGMTDEQIAGQLQQQGVPPKQIQDAIGQSNIKNAVTGNPEGGGQMQPSITEGGVAPAQPAAVPATEGTYTPSTQEMGMAPGTQQTQYGEEYYPQEGYYDDSRAGYDRQTFVEIAEQAFAEKIKPTENKLSKLNEFMNLSKTQIESMNERLQRMEKHFDKLQLEILEKIGSYGRNIAGIKDEMSMMQNSFSKIAKSKTSTKRHATTKKKSSKKYF
jgi:hypothetical protein